MTNENRWQSETSNRVVFVLVVAALATTAYMVNDNHIVQNVIKSADDFSSAMAYLTLGGWVGLALNWLFCQTPIGRVIDPSFVKLTGMSARSQWSAFGAGAIGALSTLFLLWSFQYSDPSVILPLSNITILYVFAFELITGRLNWRQAWLPVVLVVSGTLLFTYDILVGSALSGIGFLTIVVFRNMIAGVGELLEGAGVISDNATSFGFWRFFWLTIVGTVLAITTTLVRGQMDNYLQALVSTWDGIGWIVLTMFFVFFGMGLKNAAKKYVSVSKVMSYMTISIVLALPVTLLVNYLAPGTFEGVSTDWMTMLLRFGGAILIVWGIVKFWSNKDDK
jgi:hypothetical protein